MAPKMIILQSVYIFYNAQLRVFSPRKRKHNNEVKKKDSLKNLKSES